MNRLPNDKIDKLADKVAADVSKELTKHYKELRKHEISKMDALDILRYGKTLAQPDTKE
jgi:hypothetical protein